MSTHLQRDLLFEAMLPAGVDNFTPKELAGAVDMSEDFIREACDVDDIQCFKVGKTQAKGKRTYTTYRIPRVSAVTWLSAKSNFTSADLCDEISAACRRLPADLQREIYRELGRQLQT